MTEYTGPRSGAEQPAAADLPTLPALPHGLRLDRLFPNRESQFWALQFFCWTGWATAGAISWASWNDSPMVLLLYGLAALGGVVLTTGLRYVYRFIWEQPVLTRMVTAVAVSLVIAALWQAEKNAILWSLMPELYAKDADKAGQLGYFGTIAMYLYGVLPSFYIIVCWSGLYHAIKYWQMLQQEREKLLAVSSMAHQTQLRMLRYQLNPHFLFNTLNAISTLTLDQQNELANRMVMRLSSFLRYSLDSDPMLKVDLAAEIEALEMYLDIEQVRFEDRLRFEVDLADDARRALIPSLLLQPFVENAIKYAIAPSEEGGTISIRARVSGGELTMQVCDSGPGIPALDEGSTCKDGVGLANTRERLQALYGDQHEFRLDNLKPHGLCVTLRIPYETR